MAFDGQLSVQKEEAIDWNKVLREMREQGIRASGYEVHEADVEAAWASVPAPLTRTHCPVPDTAGHVQASLFWGPFPELHKGGWLLRPKPIYRKPRAGPGRRSAYLGTDERSGRDYFLSGPHVFHVRASPASGVGGCHVA